MEHPKMQIEYWPLDKLQPYARNPRKNDDAVPRLAGVIREFGFKVPIVARSTGEVIDGHLRLKAAQALGMEEVPVVLADEWTPAQVKAFRLAVNRSAEWAEWDDELLKLELDDLKLEDFDLELIGFGDVVLEGEPTPGLTDPDEVPEVQDKPVSRDGDIWTLGRHRLMCGDSTDDGSVALLMDGKKADMVLTDPPYGVRRDKGFGGAEAFNGKGTPIKRRAYDDAWDGETPPQEAFDLMLEQAPSVIVFGGNFFTDKLPCSGFWLVWDKHNTMPTFGDCELAWTNLPRQSVKKYDFQYNGLIGKEKERFHPTQKPVGLFEAILADFSAEGQTILDLFGGSGSTIIACEKTGRACRMMELSPQYVDVAVKRWQDFTGQEATLDGDGRTFAQIAAERA